MRLCRGDDALFVHLERVLQAIPVVIKAKPPAQRLRST
jgi:hypothetical protein